MYKLTHQDFYWRNNAVTKTFQEPIYEHDWNTFEPIIVGYKTSTYSALGWFPATSEARIAMRKLGISGDCIPDGELDKFLRMANNED